MSTLIVAQLLFLESENPKKEIPIYINSPGGMVTSGLAIYDTMQYIRPAGIDPLHRPGGFDGVAAAGRGAQGQALFAAQCPHHGAPALRRFPGPGADIMLHAQEILNLKQRLNEIYVTHTGQTRQGSRMRWSATISSTPRGQGIRHHRRGGRQTRGRAGRESDLAPELQRPAFGHDRVPRTPVTAAAGTLRPDVGRKFRFRAGRPAW